MSTTITFNAAAFRIAFPAFADPTAYPDNVLQVYWNTASLYISNQSYGCFCGFMSTDQRTQALNAMTAHLIAISAQIAAGDTPGIVTAATIDKVSVTIAEPPSNNTWQYWLNSTPYGQQVLALLQVAGVGGGYYGGSPEAWAFRRAPRMGC